MNVCVNTSYLPTSIITGTINIYDLPMFLKTLNVSPHKFLTFSTIESVNTPEISAFTATGRVTISIFSTVTFNASVNSPWNIRNYQKHISLLFLLFLVSEVAICLDFQHFIIVTFCSLVKQTTTRNLYIIIYIYYLDGRLCEVGAVRRGIRIVRRWGLNSSM